MLMEMTLEFIFLNEQDKDKYLLRNVDLTEKNRAL